MSSPNETHIVFSLELEWYILNWLFHKLQCSHFQGNSVPRMQAILAFILPRKRKSYNRPMFGKTLKEYTKPNRTINRFTLLKSLGASRNKMRVIIILLKFLDWPIYSSRKLICLYKSQRKMWIIIMLLKFLLMHSFWWKIKYWSFICRCKFLRHNFYINLKLHMNTNEKHVCSEIIYNSFTGNCHTLRRSFANQKSRFLLSKQKYLKLRCYIS